MSHNSLLHNQRTLVGVHGYAVPGRVGVNADIVPGTGDKLHIMSGRVGDTVNDQDIRVLGIYGDGECACVINTDVHASDERGQVDGAGCAVIKNLVK